MAMATQRHSPPRTYDDDDDDDDRVEDEDEAVVPGQRLAHVEDCAAGEGTYVRGSHIYASTVGRRRLLPPAPAPDGQQQPRGLPVVAVEKAAGGSGAGVVPRAGDVVTGVVVRVTPRVAAVSIGCVGGRAVAEAFSGIVRAQDVRVASVAAASASGAAGTGSSGGAGAEGVELYKAFRPGDVVRAEVLSLGDARSYFLSTARNDLGVVSATHSVSGAAMVPLSWNTMLCPKTNMTEPRKVAKLNPSSTSS